MGTRRAKSLLCYTALAVCCAAAAAAQDKRALIIAGDLAGRAVALEMSETFLGLGFDVQRLEVPSQGDLSRAITDLRAGAVVSAIYYAGESVDPADFVRATEMPQFVFLDACITADLADLPENVFMATQGVACDAALLPALLDRLTVPGLGSDEWDLGDTYRSQSTLTAPYVFRQPTQDVRLSADDYAMLDRLSPAARDRMVALWREAGIAVDIADGGISAPVVDRPASVALSPVRPVAPATVVSPVRPRAVSGGGVVQPAQSITVITRPQTTLVSGPVAGQGGLPAPSILVGFVVDEPPALLNTPDVPNEPVAGNAFGYEDPAAREALRAQDAALFDGLVEAGAFDPPEDEVARALQIELQRINCYTSGIDGAWGPGSQRALAEYYAQVGVPVSADAADVAAFRDVIARNDVRCPDPVVQPAPQAVAQPARQAQPAAAQSRRVAPAAPAPAPAPAPAAPARRTINQAGGTGVFR